YPPSLDRPLDSFAFCDRDNVYVASLLEDLGDRQGPFQHLLAQLQLILFRSSIDLNLKEIRSLPADRRGSGSAGDYGSDFCEFIFGSLQFLPTFRIVKLFRRLDYPMEILVLVVRPDFSKRAEPSVRGRVESQCRNFEWGRLNEGNWERHFFVVVERSLPVIYDRNLI